MYIFMEVSAINYYRCVLKFMTLNRESLSSGVRMQELLMMCGRAREADGEGLFITLK